MANRIAPLYKDAIGAEAANSSLLSAEGATTGVFLVYIDTQAYTVSDADQFYSQIAAHVVGTPVEITSKTLVNGVFDGADVSSPNFTGNSVEAFWIYRKNAGANTTWRLIAYIDTGVTNLPFTPNGSTVNLAFNASGIFAL